MANTKVTGDLIASLTIATGNIANNAITSDKISGLTTAHITEGANLYYTDARARAAVSVSGNALSYNSSTGVITSNFEESPTFTGNVTAKLSNIAGLQNMFNIENATNTSVLASFGLNLSNDQLILGSDYGASFLLKTNGTTALTIDTSQNATFAGEVKLQSSNAFTTLRTGNDYGWSIYANSSNFLTFATGAAANTKATDWVTIRDDVGNVGIGTTSPDYKLHIERTGDVMMQLKATDSNQAYMKLVNSTTGDGKFTDGLLFGLDNDESCVFWNYEATPLRFATSGTERMRIDSSGNVGIGITSGIDANLRVDANSGTLTQEILKVKGGGSGGAYGFLVEANNGDDLFKVNTLSYDSYFPNGKVGIGTSSPNRKLTVQNGSYGYPSSGIDTNSFFAIANNSWAGMNILSSNNTGGFIDFGDTDYGHRGRILYGHSPEYMKFDVAQTEKMRITSDGMVGIGMTPNTAGSSTYMLQMYNPGAQCFLSLGNGTSGNGPLNGLVIGNDASNAYIVNREATSLIFATSDANRMVILAGGNVGINTTSPASKLDVKGCVAMGAAITDNNIAYSSSGFGNQDGGSLHINYSLSGSTSSGDTITFTYAATNWKSWSLKYNFASTSGITEGVVGGYWNNSGSSGNYTSYNQHGVSVAVTHTGQGNTVTFTFTNLGTHPMANFVYIQGGGDGQPRADRVTLTSST